VTSQPPTRSPSQAATPTTPKQARRGEIPKYLIQRKLEWAKREQERLMELQKEKVPKGHSRMWV
jgi:hypothetical protein